MLCVVCSVPFVVVRCSSPVVWYRPRAVVCKLLNGGWCLLLVAWSVLFVVMCCVASVVVRALLAVGSGVGCLVFVMCCCLVLLVVPLCVICCLVCSVCCLVCVACCLLFVDCRWFVFVVW